MPELKLQTRQCPKCSGPGYVLTTWKNRAGEVRRKRVCRTCRHGWTVIGEHKRPVYEAPRIHHPLIRKLFKEIYLRDLTFDWVAEVAGVSDNTLSGWVKGKAPMFLNLEAVFNALGFDIVAVRRQELKAVKGDKS